MGCGCAHRGGFVRKVNSWPGRAGVTSSVSGARVGVGWRWGSLCPGPFRNVCCGLVGEEYVL